MSTTLPCTTFPAARYRFSFQVERFIRLPEYAGSTLRGVFGSSLRRIVCLTGEKECIGCSLLRTCPYSLLFSAPPPEQGHAVQDFANIPNPYVLEPPSWGKQDFRTNEILDFHMILIGKALDQLALVVLAWQRAMAQRVGSSEGAATMLGVWLELADGTEQQIFDPAEGLLIDHEPILPLPVLNETTRSCTLRIQTPLRLQRQGTPLGPDRLTPRDFLIHLARRISLLSEFHAGLRLELDFAELGRQAETLTAQGSLRWQDWSRWSNRQEQTMTLGGVVGTWSVSGTIGPFLPLLHLGQWLHVGKNATFGLGKYHLTEIHS